MNLLDNNKIRLSIIFVLASVQVVTFTIVPKPYSDYLFYFLNLTYFVLGFLSLDWRQALKNISFVTLPAVILIALLLLVIAVLKGRVDEALQTIEVAAMMWALLLVVGLPIFLFGFGCRFLALNVLKKRS
jgi:hypothetical protein